MSIDIQDISDGSVKRLTRVLCRRPEYGVAIPSRRWLIRQDEKLKALPTEVLRPSNLFKRLALKIVNSIDPSVIDPRAVLCKTHTALNPWLVRRLFLAIAYEVTVHTDALRSWKEKRDNPVLAAFVGRVDAIAALWTEPSLYCQCYGTPPFENHMVFVQSSCEACILAALGANARVLADLRATLVDRVERRRPRKDGRPAKEARLSRYVEEWINHLQPERAAKCKAMSETVLTQLRATRSELTQWRNRRRKERRNSQLANQPVYTELRNTRSGPKLSIVPSDAPRKRRTKGGIPVAIADLEGAEDQRRIAMFSINQEANDGNKSIFRPDSICDNSRFGQPGPAYDPTNEQPQPTNDYVYPQYDDYDDEEGLADLERDYDGEEASRRKVAEWYTTRLEETGPDRTADDAKSMISMIHPAFRSVNDVFSNPSAAPQPLMFKKDRTPTSDPSNTRSTVWTDATVYTANPSTANDGQRDGQRDVPPVPRVPSAYRHEENRRSGSGRASSSRTSRPRSTIPASSSVYSDEIPPAPSGSRSSRPTSTPARNPVRNFLFTESEAATQASTGQRQYVHSRQRMRSFAREDNPFTREGTPRTSTPRNSAPDAAAPSHRGTPVSSMTSSSHANTVIIDDYYEPSTMMTDEDLWRDSWANEPIRPEDSLTMAMWRAEDEAEAEVSPWSFLRKR
ncbi:hypothetical protein F5Y13DRAFT_58852 [Hypoxylon sp. FL1857]|nr:hypothetical protein F5Y13DRAFT_58852 [Hypoxylon sp. FL1857]